MPYTYIHKYTDTYAGIYFEFKIFRASDLRQETANLMLNYVITFEINDKFSRDGKS